MENQQPFGLPQKQPQSSQTELGQVLSKFGEGYSVFLQRYPTLQKRTDLITSSMEAVRNDGTALSVVDRTYGKGASEWWLKYMLIELFTFLGAMDSVSVYQVKAIAARIRAEYYYMTPDELTYFFYSFSLGDYGKLYAGRTVNPQDILIALRRYTKDVFEARDYVAREKRQQEMDAALNDPDLMSYEEYLIIKQVRDEYTMLTREEELKIEKDAKENRLRRQHDQLASDKVHNQIRLGDNPQFGKWDK